MNGFVKGLLILTGLAVVITVAAYVGRKRELI